MDSLIAASAKVHSLPNVQHIRHLRAEFSYRDDPVYQRDETPFALTISPVSAISMPRKPARRGKNNSLPHQQSGRASQK